MEAAATTSTLCLTCGLCCDGTLFGSVPLQAADALAPLRAGGIDIGTNQRGRSFTQPCSAYQRGCCQVYASRPATCVKYRCELLKKYERGTVSWAEAQQRIGRVEMLKATLRAELARIVPSGDEMSVVAVLRIVPDQQELAADGALRKTWAPVMLRLSALIDGLRRHFQPPRQDRVAASPDEAVDAHESRDFSS